MQIFFATLLALVGALAFAQPASAEKNCDKKWAKCMDNADYAAGVSKKLGEKAYARCESNVLICRVSGYWPPTGEKMPPGPPIKDADPAPPKDPKAKGKGGKFAGGESGWNGKYTSIVIRDGRGTRVLTFKQGVPVEYGLMVLAPNGVRYHVWDLKLAAQLESLGVNFAYANDNTAREVFAKAKAEADANARKKIAARGERRKVDQAIGNDSGLPKKGMNVESRATPVRATSPGANTPAGPIRTATSPGATSAGAAKPVMILAPGSGNSKRQPQ